MHDGLPPLRVYIWHIEDSWGSVMVLATSLAQALDLMRSKASLWDDSQAEDEFLAVLSSTPPLIITEPMVLMNGDVA